MQDGKVTKDYPNENADTLEYHLDNKIYLQDMEETKTDANGKIELAIYTEPNMEKMQVTIAIRNNNLYIQAKDKKVEVVDEDSAIELVNDHYQKIDKSIYEKYTYDLDAVSDQKYTPKYRSIYGLFRSIRVGFRRILNYSIIKKILLLGFFRFCDVYCIQCYQCGRNSRRTRNRLLERRQTLCASIRNTCIGRGI